MVTVDYMVMADAAAVAEGKHYIHGAGWDHITAQTFPLTYPQIAVAVRIAVPWLETNRAVMLAMDVMDADGNSILPDPPGALRTPITIGRPPQATVGSDLYVPFVFNLVGLQFASAGTYAIVLQIDDVEAKRTLFHVATAS